NDTCPPHEHWPRGKGRIFQITSVPPALEQFGFGPRIEDDMRRAVEGSSHDELTFGFPFYCRAILCAVDFSIFLSSMGVLLLFQFVDKFVQFVEACGPELAVALDPCRLLLQCASAELQVRTR